MIPQSTLGIVIPTLNSESYLRSAIFSVATQEVDLEYKIHLHIQDGGSTDKTLQIIHEFEEFYWPKNFLFTYSSEPDKNMYDALNKGFSNIDAEIMTYLGSDDIFYPLSFHSAISFLQNNQNFQWITGLHQLIGEKGLLLIGSKSETNNLHGYPNSLLRAGVFDGKVHGFVMAEGTYWTKSTWAETNKKFDETLKLAGDFELWNRFSLKYELVQLDVHLAAHRKRTGQLSGDIRAYYSEVDQILSRKKQHEKLIQFSKFGYCASWDDKNDSWSISEEIGREAWKGKIDFYIEAEDGYFEGPYPEDGISEEFIWIGKSTKFYYINQVAKRSKPQSARLRVLNDLDGNNIVIRQGRNMLSIPLQNSEQIQEYLFELDDRIKFIDVESEKVKIELGGARKLGFKLLTLEVV